MRPIGSALTAIAMLAIGESCTGTLPSGASCSATSECETGLACLYAIGSGCNASGMCVVPSSDCSGSSAGLSLCGCGAPLDLSCLPSIAALPQRTATGPACVADAGADAGDAAQ
jgi:hypothetical protein